MADKRELFATRDLNLSADDIKSMQGNDWSDADIRILGGVDLTILPIHLRYIEYEIRCYPGRGWRRLPGKFIPGNSVIKLHSHVGSMEMGWDRWVDPTGKFLDNGERHRALSHHFTRHPDWNAFCFLVSTPTIVFRNGGIPDWAASVGDLSVSWTVGQDDGGDCETAFNDTDSNNTGGFLQKIRIYSQSTFAEIHKDLV